MDAFVFSPGFAIPGATEKVEGVSFFGPPGLLKRHENELVIELGSLGGAYSRLIYDKPTGALKLESDITGQLALRFAFVDGQVIVSSHDILLAPFLAYEPDEASLAAIARFGWSVGGYALVRNITVCRGGEGVLIGRDGRVTVTPAQFPQGRDPVQSMLDYLGSKLPAGPVTVELSAGWDSRAALAATLACKSVSDIRVFSEGPEGSLDVCVAKDLCKTLGISFTRRETKVRAPVDILGDWTASAWRNNGNIEIDVLASRQRTEGPVVCGDGGEIHRGNYYPYVPFGRLRKRQGYSPEQALARKFGASGRLSEAVERLSADRASSAEVLDRFYAVERYGIWNQKLAREGSTRISPFEARASMVELGKGEQCGAHLSLIRKYLPSAMQVPINGQATPNDYAGGLVRDFILESRIFAGKVQGRLSRRADLQGSRASVMEEALRTLPADFIMGDAKSWAEYGARRFLKLYSEISLKGHRPLHVVLEDLSSR